VRHAGGAAGKIWKFFRKTTPGGGNYSSVGSEITLLVFHASWACSPMPQISWQTALAQHDRWLRTVVFARVGQLGAVDEVMQEVALAAIRQQAPLLDATKIAPWLYRLAVTQSLLFRRKQGRWRKLTARYAQREQPTEHDRRTPDPLEWLLADEQKDLVHQAVARLPRGEAEILLLKYTENWTYEQLAQHLGTSGSAIESRLHRARQRLRKSLTTFAGVKVEP
jgi:RNA polymerase sigma factor (sigma-70 family)